MTPTGGREQAGGGGIGPTFDRLPDELVEHVVDAVAACPPTEATGSLRSLCLVSRQWGRIASARLARRPCLRVDGPQGARAFLRSISPSSAPVDGSERSDDRRGRLRALQVLGQPQWRHRATLHSRPPLLQPATLVSILNQLESASALEVLLLVELPWTRCGFVGHVRPWPATLTTLILLSPLNASELFALLHNFGHLENLVIAGAAHDELRAAAAHYDAVAYSKPAPYRLKSFGIVSRTLSHWLKTGLGWGERDLRWVVSGSSLERLSSVHIEFADDDDAVFVTQLCADHAPLEELRLRAMQQSVISTCLGACPDLKRLHLGSIYSMGLRSTSAAWKAIPSRLEHLCVDVMRLEGHGPWNQRSAGALAESLDHFVSHKSSSLVTLASLLDGRAFARPSAADASKDDPVARFYASCAARGIKVMQSTFDQSVVPPPDGSGWY